MFFVCFFLFVFLSTISRQPAGRFTPNFACGHTLVPDVSSPLLGVSGPGGGGAEKRGNEIFVTIGVNGEFLHFERNLSNAWTDQHQIRIFDHFENLRPYISATVINRSI